MNPSRRYIKSLPAESRITCTSTSRTLHKLYSLVSISGKSKAERSGTYHSGRIEYSSSGIFNWPKRRSAIAAYEIFLKVYTKKLLDSRTTS